MDGRNLWITFSSALSQLTERNSSFDSGILRVAYTGQNRNGSYISKEAFERSIESIYNCPIVCRYDRETDTIGSHDMELVRRTDGSLDLVNLTQPVGVVPESASYYWETIEDDSGAHEYLCIYVLLWKRQEAYQKIKQDGITDESMEISVLEGQMVDGVYRIDRFEFTAFCLLGTAEPCFESASLEMATFSHAFREEFTAMMQELKESFSKIAADDSADGNDLTISTEGGEAELEQNMEQINPEMEEQAMALEEQEVQEEKIESEQSVEEPVDPVAFEQAQEPEQIEPEEQSEESFALLAEQFLDEMIAQLSVERVQTEWGDMPRYHYMDHSVERSEVYCYDMEDWNLYGFPYAMDGDHIMIDFEQKRRKKMDIVDFDEGEQTSVFAAVYAQATAHCEDLNNQMAQMQQELDTLRQYQIDTQAAAEAKALEDARNTVFAEFDDLAGDEAFEALRQDCGDLSPEALKDRCYAIRGKNMGNLKFARTTKAPKLPVERMEEHSDEPYGGIFVEFGIG